MECGMSLIKYILFVFNLIFALSGIILITVGAYILGNVNDFKFFINDRIIAPPVVLIVAGLLVFVVAFLGCYGAIRENYTLLMAFALALLVIFTIELAVGIAGAVFKNDFQMVMKSSMKNSMIDYTSAEEMAWDKVQKTFACCGVDAPEDWALSSTARGKSAEILPNSCCRDIQYDNMCTTSVQTGQNSPYKEGCWATLESKLKNSASLLIGVGIGIAIIEIVGIVFACCLAMTIKKEAREK